MLFYSIPSSHKLRASQVKNVLNMAGSKTPARLWSSLTRSARSLNAVDPADTNTHIVPMPAWASITGCAKFVIAILVLIFTAAAAAIWGSAYSAFGVSFFTASATLVIFVYYFVALTKKVEWYNRWAVLALEAFGTIFWLVSFALLADWTATFNGSDYWYGAGDSYGFWRAPYSPDDVTGMTGSGLGKRSSNNKYKAGLALAGTAAGLGAAEL